jgi:hypothetical protein
VSNEEQTSKAKEEQREQLAVGSLEKTIEPLEKYGGFKILKNTIRTFSSKGKQRAGVDNLDPEKRARKDIFYKDPHWSQARKELKNRLQLWKDLLSDSQDFEQLLSKSIERSNRISTLIDKNLKIASKTVRNLETSYRTLASFYTNSEKSKGAKVENVDIINVSLEQLKDKDNPIFLSAVSDQFNSHYNRLDLMNNYSLLVVPGWLGSAQDVDRLAEVASRHKVMFVTDFIDVDGVEDALTMLESYQLQSADLHKAYTCMTCNYLVGRPGTEGIDEEIYIPGSSALAGLMAANPLQQPQAGVTHGRLKEVSGVKFPIKHTELGDLNELGIIPMTFEFGKALAFGTSTLFNGDEVGYKNYSVMRTHDYIIKTIKDLFNRYTFRLIDFDLKKDIRSKLNKFFESNKGSGKLINKYEIKDLEVIDDDKLRINIDVQYWYPARVLEINLKGLEGTNTKEWDDHATD